MGNRAENIKSRILFALLGAGFLLMGLSLIGSYCLQRKAIEDSVDQRISGVQRLFEALLQEEAQLMNGQIDFIKAGGTVFDLFAARKREELAEKVRPIFERMQARYRITHFYFHDPDQVCFLRVHAPDRYGDRIGRFTMQGAASTHRPFHGIELGPLGTFTLRTVHPWVRGDGGLVGYIELGMEIEHLTRLMKQALNLDLFVVIRKQFLNRENWEEGLKILKRKGDWDLFDDFVMIDGTMQASPALAEVFRRHHKDHETIIGIKLGDRRYKGRFGGLTDAGGRHVGAIFSMVDVSTQTADLWILVGALGAVSLVIGGGVLLFFNVFIGGLQNRLKETLQKLKSEIAARRQSEAALATSEKRFRSLFEESKDAIVGTDRQGYLNLLNPAGIDLFGLSAQEDLPSINFRDLYVDRTSARKFSSAIDRQGFIREFGARLKGRNGKTMDCLMTVTVKKGSEGQMLGYEGIVRDVTPYIKMEQELRRLATTDSLTGINNRRHFTDLTQKEINRSRRYGHPLALIMLDIDHFKRINDVYGHAAGDQVLCEFCDVCVQQIRENDIMGRLGGEEFAIALAESDVNRAWAVAERIRSAVSALAVAVNGREIHFTVSLGITEYDREDDLDAMLERADRALYQAKQSGRNQVRTCT